MREEHPPWPECVAEGCTFLTMPSTQWSKLSEAIRKKLMEQGIRRRGGRWLCHPCYQELRRAIKAGSLTAEDLPPRRQRKELKRLTAAEVYELQKKVGIA